MQNTPSAKEIFLRALEIEDSQPRSDFLASACANDDTLRRRVDALLAAHDDPDSYLERPAARFDVTATTDGTGRDSGLSDSSSSHHGRFLPGTKVAGRYRIVSMLGRGGMGEVYRADDLRLGQTVALKFLPPELAKDAKRLEYFHNEVHLARQISHPNVCRVYDIGEVDGQHFISMEYIDGEDLKVLLHRIGRLPVDKGVQIAQQLCAGLAAAHAKGVLHRDLKPANIMIDGQGQVRITDFGLATGSANDGNIVGMSGTPAYMAPEQLLRGQTSIQSDIYALGLILHEVFTGKSIHSASSIADLRRFHEETSQPTSGTNWPSDMDPAVDRAIRKCLEPDPADRPSSVSSLAASLPGGDPLAAAIAAGETPSPELIMLAGGPTAISQRQLVSCLFALAISMFVFLGFANRSLLVNQLDFPDSPDVLKHKAKTVLRDFGFTKQPFESAFGADIDEAETFGELAELSPKELNSIKVFPHVRFWYRESPRELPVDAFWRNGVGVGRGQVRANVPGVSIPGELVVGLDRRGWLRTFQYCVDGRVFEADVDAKPDWNQLLSKDRIGFGLTNLQSAEALRAPPCAFDQVQAWEGQIPGTNERVYVHAASIRGIPTFLEIVPHGSDGSDRRGDPAAVGMPQLIVGMGLFGIFFALNCVAILLAIRSLRSGRADRRGAFRLAATVFVANMIAWACVCRHLPHPGEYFQLLVGIALALLISAMIWVFYLAIEPFGRREWPELLIGWRRLLDGRFKDARVGRDILIGVSAGSCIMALCTVARLTGAYRPIPPFGILGFRQVVDQIVTHETFNLLMTLATLLLLLISRRLTGSQRKAVCLTFVVQLAFWLLSFQMPTIGVAFGAINLGIELFVLMRFGLLALVLVEMRTIASVDSPFTTDPEAFYFGYGLVGILIYLALAVLGAYFATNRGSTIRFQDSE